MKHPTVKVLYIAGPTRSGSTLLSNILGECDGCFNAGELIEFWECGLARNGSCGCGLPAKECRIWGAVLREGFGGPAPVDLDEMIRLGRRAARASRVPWRMCAPGARRRLGTDLAPYLGAVERLYRAVQSVTGCEVIIDSSKHPGYADVLTMIPTIDLHIAHLVRDSRAAAYSWLREKNGLRRKNCLNSSVAWSLWNVTAELLASRVDRKYYRLSYEDLISHPRESLARVLALVQKTPGRLPFLSKDEVRLGVNHTIYGNPDRFRNGVCKLRIADEWMTAGMGSLDKAIVTMLTWPFLVKYGYSPFPRPGSGSRKQEPAFGCSKTGIHRSSFHGVD